MSSLNNTFPIVGMKYHRPALALVNILPVNTELLLEAEPTNEYDPNAIKVLIATNELHKLPREDLETSLASCGFEINDLDKELFWHLGYIPKDFAAMLKEDDFPEDTLVTGVFTISVNGRPCVTITERF